MRILALIVLVLSAASPVFADSIGTYTFTGTASGTIGGTVFSNAALTVTASGFISTITNGAGIFLLNVPGGSASFTIIGVGSGTFTDATYVFDNTGLGIAGFGDLGPSPCCDIIQIRDSDIGSSAFASYDLKSSIGPLGGAPDPALAQWVGRNTSLGSFTVTQYNGVTFQATVPEPATLTLL